MRYIHIWAILMLALLSACQESDKQVRVGFLLADYNIPRWEREADLFKAKMTELGAKAWVEVADGDAALQQKQAEALIEKGIDVLVLNGANANTAAEIVRNAKSEGVQVIAYDGLIFNTELDYLVGFDLERVGELQAQYVVDKLGEGNFAIFNGDKAHAASSDMNRGINKVLSPFIKSGKVNVVYNAWIENWSAINAEFYTDKVLEFANTPIDAIIAASDAMAGGVSDELQKRALNGQVLITGQDGELPACWRILNEKQSMTVYKSSKLIAESTALLAYDIAQGKSVDGLNTRFNGMVEVPSMILDPVVVDIHNLSSTIIAEGIFTEEEIKNYK